MGTPADLSSGTVEITVGALAAVAAPVLKVQGLGANPPAARLLPAKSLAPEVTVAVNVVLAARALAGVKVAIEPALPAYVTAPLTTVVPGPVKVNVVAVRVLESSPSLKAAVIF